MSATYDERILKSLRRITRSIDLYSRQLASRFGLTGPQLVCLRALAEDGPSTPSHLARRVDLSQATMTGILDRLEGNGLVRRVRDTEDRRRVHVSLTDAGQAVLDKAPSALQDKLVRGLAALDVEAQAAIATTLEQVVKMMDAEALEVSSVLTSGPVDASTDALAELLGEPGDD